MTGGSLMRDVAGRLRGFAHDRGALLRLLRFATPGPLVGFGIVGGIAAGGPVVSAFLTARLVGDVQAGASTGSALVLQSSVLALLLVSTQLANSLKDGILERVAASIDGQIRSTVRRLATGALPFAVVESRAFQDDAARACDPGQMYRSRTGGAASTGQLWLSTRIVTTIALAAVLATVNVGVAIVVTVGSFWIRSIVRRQWLGHAKVEDEGASVGQDAQRVEDTFADPRNARELAVFGFGPWLAARWRSLYAEATGPGDEVVRRIVRHQWAPTLLGLAVVGATFAWLGLDLSSGRIRPDQAALALSSMVSILSIMAFIGVEAWDIDYGMGAVRAFLRIGAAKARPVAYAPLPAPYRPTAIALDRVSFSYADGQPVLSDLSLNVHPGERLAIVGRNGAGKSTLTKLVAGLYLPRSGFVTIGGEPASTGQGIGAGMTVATMSQEFLRMPFSLRENVTLGAPTDDADIWAALDVVGLGETLRAEGVGLDANLWSARSDARDLSGGQWQRLCLARAILAVRRGKRILVLDEPTSHLDIEGETRFYQEVMSALHGTTVLLITHRLSTIRSADRIAMLDGGRITELGTHDALMERGGSYAAMYRAQADRFVERSA